MQIIEDKVSSQVMCFVSDLTSDLRSKCQLVRGKFRLFCRLHYNEKQIIFFLCSFALFI